MAAPRTAPADWVYRMPVQQAFLQCGGEQELLAKARRAGMLEAAVIDLLVEFGDLDDDATVEYTVRLQASFKTQASYNKLVAWGYMPLAQFSSFNDHARLAERIGLDAVKSHFPGNYIDAAA